MLAAAAERAVSLGIGADRVLIAARIITEDAYVVALAASLRVAYEPLDVPRAACPLSDDHLVHADARGQLLLRNDDGARIGVIAPHGLIARQLASGAHALPQDRFRLTSARRLRAFMLRHAEGALGARAADGLRGAHPEWSAAARPFRLRIDGFIALAAALMAAIAFPGAALTAVSVLLTLTFLAWTALRLTGAMTRWRTPPVRRPAPDRLPVYTLILALYNEAAAVEGLVASLSRLEYPPEKLQILLVLEPDDHGTREALARLDLTAPFEVLVAPDAGPRTKPKALNAALALARGSFTAVYDAEDRPEPDQLRRALDVFLAEDEQLACVQARLTIDNTEDGWLARMFTAEYAGLFDALLPGLSVIRLPLPLGGSSNHFRTQALRDAGGWDAYNVTEDADLGMRLARMQYRTAVIGSTTYEEAPARLAPWLRQRTRWFKGWMQTWLVHMRHPIALARELGAAGFITFQLVVGGTVLSALVHPLFIAQLFYALTVGPFVPPEADVWNAVVLWLAGGALFAGYATSFTLGLIGLKRRKLLRHAWALLLMPAHWLLLSTAAWRALYQLLRDPYRWEKTEHGLAETSRLADNAPPRPAFRVRNSGADRRRHPRAAASG